MRPSTLLFRHVHPSWIQDGEVSSQAFRPTPKDNHRLSVYDGDQIDAESSWVHFTQSLGLESAGALAVTVLECTDEALSVEADPEPFPEHVVVNF